MNNKYIGTSSFYKRALMIALPVIGQLLIQSLVSLIDNFMVAGLGDIKMGGVNSNAWMVKLEQAYQKAELAFGNSQEFERLVMPPIPPTE